MPSDFNKKKRTDSGIALNSYYTSGTAGAEIPGKFPFTRGIYPEMYRQRLWTMRQYAGFSTAEESNQRYHYLLSQGTSGLSVAFDLPTQIGYDSNHALSEGEVGKVGVAIDMLSDMETLFDGIDLQKVTTSMTINATASTLLAMYVAVAKKKGNDISKISGTVQNDILKEYAARGTYIYPVKPSMRIITDMFEWCSKELPKWNTISISGYHIREAGSTAAQELAFTLANGQAYVQAALQKDLDINIFGKRLSFFFNAHNNFFEEVAKFRAARRMWAKMMESMGAKTAEAKMLRFHTQTGGSTLTAQQPHNNVSRVTLQALSAVLGGTQSLHTNGFDEALGLPTESAATIALRTQQIIGFESGVADVADPLGGSYYIEYLTDAIEAEAKKIIDYIHSLGGSVAAIESGWMQNEIAKSSYAYQKDIESKEKIIVGLNDFQSSDNSNIPILEINDNIREKQIQKIRNNSENRSNDSVEKCLKKLKFAAKDGNNLMPLIIESVENHVTLGEVANALREVFGEYKG